MQLRISNIKEAEDRGFFIFRTRDGKYDLLSNLKWYILKKSGYLIPDGIKFERRAIKHIFDNHGYDTELWWGTSISYEHFIKIPEILADYDECSEIMFTDDVKEYIRFHLKKSYGSDCYNLVVEILQNNFVKNQLWVITLYINDVVWGGRYLEAKQRGDVKKLRARIREDYKKH